MRSRGSPAAGRAKGWGDGSRRLGLPRPAASITGTFRLLKEDKPLFYEYWLLADHGKGTTLRLKHFNADMTGWEEKDEFVEFPFIGIIDGVVHFRGLSYRRDSDDGMTIFLALTTKDGMREETFRLKRAP
jgi:hypothetical protein